MHAVATTGSLANQKYEVNKNIQRHLHIINHSAPSHETTRWKAGTAVKPIGTNIAKGKLLVEEINQRNEALSTRLFTIMNEQREARSYEFAPGWRTGLGKNR